MSTKEKILQNLEEVEAIYTFDESNNAIVIESMLEVFNESIEMCSKIATVLYLSNDETIYRSSSYLLTDLQPNVRIALETKRNEIIEKAIKLFHYID